MVNLNVTRLRSWNRTKNDHLRKMWFHDIGLLCHSLLPLLLSPSFFLPPSFSPLLSPSFFLPPSFSPLLSPPFFLPPSFSLLLSSFPHSSSPSFLLPLLSQGGVTGEEAPSSPSLAQNTPTSSPSTWGNSSPISAKWQSKSEHAEVTFLSSSHIRKNWAGLGAIVGGAWEQ